MIIRAQDIIAWDTEVYDEDGVREFKNMVDIKPALSLSFHHTDGQHMATLTGSVADILVASREWFADEHRDAAVLTILQESILVRRV